MRSRRGRAWRDAGGRDDDYGSCACCVWGIPADGTGQFEAYTRAAGTVHLLYDNHRGSAQPTDGVEQPTRTDSLRRGGLGARRKFPSGSCGHALVYEPIQPKLSALLSVQPDGRSIQPNQSALFLSADGSVCTDIISIKGEIKWPASGTQTRICQTRGMV